MILFLYSPDARDVAFFFSLVSSFVVSVCVVCVLGVYLVSPLYNFFPNTFFLGGLGTQPLLHFCVCPSVFVFFSFSYFSSTPFVDLFYIRQFQLPFILFFTRPLYLFFVPIMWSSSINIYIYIYYCVCVGCILSLGRKKKKSNNFFGHILFSFPGGIYYYILYAIYFYFSAKFVDKNNR